MTASRRLAAGVLAVLATVLLPLGLLSAWVAAVVTDTDRYVATVAPLATDPVVKRAAVRELDREAMKLVDLGAERVDLNQYLADTGYGALVGPGNAKISAAARKQIAAVVHTSVAAGIESPQFAQAWTVANRSAHEQLVAALEGDDRAVVDDNGSVTIELGTILNTIVAELTDRGLLPGGTVPELHASFTLVKSGDLAKARTAYRWLDAVGFWLPALWVLAASLALLASTARRRLVRRLALGALAGVVCLAVVLALARQALADRSSDPDVTRAVWDIVTTDLTRWYLVAGASAVALFAASFVVPGRARDD